jgi:hypothetical protein
VRRLGISAALPGILLSWGTPSGAEDVPEPQLTTTNSAFAIPQSRLESGFIQYGAALTAELLASAGSICPSGADAPCVVGSGGGLAVRVGYRFHSPLYLGGAYEASKQDAHKALTLAILQQLRAEARYILPGTSTLSPFVTGGVGVVFYGSEWALDTWGSQAFLGIGSEIAFSRTALVAISVSYRAILLQPLQVWKDSTYPTGLMSMVGLEMSFEQRSPTYEPPNP